MIFGDFWAIFGHFGSFLVHFGPNRVSCAGACRHTAPVGFDLAITFVLGRFGPSPLHLWCPCDVGEKLFFRIFSRFFSIFFLFLVIFHTFPYSYTGPAAGRAPKVSKSEAKSALGPPTPTQTSVTLLQMPINCGLNPKNPKKLFFSDFWVVFGHFWSFSVFLAQNR